MTEPLKASVEQAPLLRCLTRMTRVIEKRNTVPILANVMLRFDVNRLWITGTDLDIKLSDSLAARVHKSGETTVPAQLLHDIVRKMPVGAEIAIEQPEGGAANTIVVKAGRSRFTLPTLPVSDFPNLSSPADEEASRFEIRGGDLHRLIGRTEFAISSEETRYYLNGIYLHTHGGDNSQKLRAVATDGHRLAQADFPIPDGAKGMRGVIVPRKTVGEIARLFDADEEIAVSVSSSKIALESGELVLISKLIDGTFPDYNRVVPINNGKTLLVDRVALDEATGRVAVVSTEKGRAVRLAIEPGKLVLSVTNPDSGSATEELEVEFDGEPMQIGFNSQYLGDMLRRLSGDKITVKLADPGSPTLFSGSDPDALYVLMPMRV
ncbi:DNA polymerase III subunit beta [Rhodopseudomonas palustris]|uniref:DNA polymerase III subunit beta n=1 Tax=Rhodopseudomonas palustris TaxID=1076 RepID=UPI0022F043A4|nr:DNA polymerase III subunit beta [Rhodopseudomonas palustris]WBU27547.1 DNA polymerase III subunit beta [Rhodopseudomonas palustris]